MNLKTTAAIIAIASGITGTAIGYLSAVANAGGVVDAKIDRAIRPIESRIDSMATDVREIRNLLSTAILGGHP